MKNALVTPYTLTSLLNGHPTIITISADGRFDKYADSYLSWIPPETTDLIPELCLSPSCADGHGYSYCNKAGWIYARLGIKVEQWRTIYQGHPSRWETLPMPETPSVQHRTHTVGTAAVVVIWTASWLMSSKYKNEPWAVDLKQWDTVLTLDYFTPAS